MSKQKIIETKIIGPLESPTKIRLRRGKVKVYRNIVLIGLCLDKSEGFRITHRGAIYADLRGEIQSYQLDERRWVHIPLEPTTTRSGDTEDISAPAAPKEDTRTDRSKRAIEIESKIINGLAYFKCKRLGAPGIQYQLESGHIIQARWLSPTEDSESHCDLVLKVNGIDHRILGVFPETSKASIFNNICRAINFFGRGVTK